MNFAGRNLAGGVDEAGLTPQRRVVLEVIRESDAHPTANDVFAGARAKLESISYATVYNSLHYLCEAGLVREITFGNGASRFDRITSRHDHALCELCGKLVDFDLTETPDLMRKAARRVHFKPVSIHLTLFGLCPDCQKDDASPT
jgi:Fur family transcriptional regulator, peroxide stress response regulator